MRKIYRERIKKWVEALESGEYVQTKGSLMAIGDKYDKFCCLGVACDLHARKTGRGWDGEEYIGDVDLLPAITRKYYDLTSIHGNIADTPDVSLISLNDNLHFTFKEIALVIRKYILDEDIKLPRKIMRALRWQ